MKQNKEKRGERNVNEREQGEGAIWKEWREDRSVGIIYYAISAGIIIWRLPFKHAPLFYLDISASSDNISIADRFE